MSETELEFSENAYFADSIKKALSSAVAHIPPNAKYRYRTQSSGLLYKDYHHDIAGMNGKSLLRLMVIVMRFEWFEFAEHFFNFNGWPVFQLQVR